MGHGRKADEPLPRPLLGAEVRQGPTAGADQSHYGWRRNAARRFSHNAARRVARHKLLVYPRSRQSDTAQDRPDTRWTLLGRRRQDPVWRFELPMERVADHDATERYRLLEACRHCPARWLGRHADVRADDLRVRV